MPYHQSNFQTRVLAGRLCVIGLMAAGVCALLAAAAPVDPKVREAHRHEAHRKQYQIHVDRLSKLPLQKAKSLGDVLQLRTENGELVGVSPLVDAKTPRAFQYQLQVPQLKGLTTIQFTPGRNANVAQQYAPGTMLHLYNWDLGADDALISIDALINEQSINISRTTEADDGTETVRLTCQKAQNGRPAQTQLFVSSTGAQTTHPYVRVTSPDFQTLVREHPQEVNKSLRPLLHDLQQDAVFAPDARLAWQVFADGWQPDPQMSRQVQSLLPALNQPDFHVRERAVGLLRELGQPAAEAMVHLNRAALSPQQNLLIDRALEPYTKIKPEEAQRLRTDRGFLLDCLYVNDHAIRAAALAQLQKLSDQPLAFNVDASATDRNEAIDAIRQKLLPEPAPAND